MTPSGQTARTGVTINFGYVPSTNAASSSYSADGTNMVVLRNSGTAGFDKISKTFSANTVMTYFVDHSVIGEVLSGKDTKKLAKASSLSQSDDPKDQARARARQTEIDYKDLIRQRKSGKVGVGKSMKEGKSWKQWKTAAKAAIGKKTPKHDYGKDAGAEAAKRLRKKDHEKVNFLDPED